MSGYLGTKAVLLSTTAATVSGSSTVGAGLTVDNDGATVLTVDRATSDGTIIDVQRGGTSTATIGVSAGDDVYFAGATGSTKGIYFNANGLLPATTGGSASDGTVDIGEGITRWKDLYLSGGVYLGGTGSANHLDDYEEGTYDVTYSGDSGTPITRTANGKYIKIGRMVYISFYSYAGSNPTVPSGSCYVSLPFTADTSGHLTYMHIMQAYAGGLSLNTIGASNSRRWQINNSTQLTSYTGTWASSPSYYELSGAGCYLAAS